MKKLLKFLLVVFIWLIILGISLVSAILLDYPEDTGFKIFIFIFFAWYGTRFVVYLYKRWQAKKRVEKLINVDTLNKENKHISFFQFLFTKDIDKHINKVINKVTKSGIESQSVNNLTWAMHLKLVNKNSDWLTQASVNKPKFKDPIFVEYKHVDWLIFNQFMMLDVDSYLMQESNPSAKSEWLQLLNGLSYSNKRKSLDNLLISIHIDELRDADCRNKYADIIRAKYEDIKEYCGVDVPVSIVLIGMEKLSGVDTWLADISEDWKCQVLGNINPDNVNSEKLVKDSFDKLINAFKQGSLNSLVKNGFNSTIASLPQKTESLRTLLSSFTGRFFYPNKFQTAPICSGLFMVIKHDKDYLFVDSLLEGRSLCWSASNSTNRSTISDRKKYKKLATFSITSILLSILLGILHNGDKQQIDQIFDRYKQSISISDEKSKIIDNFQSRYELIQNLSELNLGHWFASATEIFKIPTLEARLKKDIRDLLIEPIDNDFEQRLVGFDKTNLDAKVDYLNVLMRRINIINAASQGTSFADLKDLPQPFDSIYIKDMSVSLIDGINDVYLKNLIMTRNSGDNNYLKVWRGQVNSYRDKVTALLISSDGTMEWLTNWVDSNSNIKPIELNDYWQGSKTNISLIKIQPTYTSDGKSSVDEFIQQLTDALGENNPFLVANIPEFQTQYEKNFVANWGAFLQNFNNGEATLNNREEWLNIINNLTNSRNIYFKLLNDADFHLGSLNTMIDKPDWFEFILYYQNMLALGQDENQGNPKKNKVFTKLGLKVVSALGPVGKALSGSAKSGLKTKKKLDKAEGAGPGATERELNLQDAASTLDDYKKTVADLVFNIEQPQQSYTNIKGYFEFENNPSAAGTKLGVAKLSVKKLQSLIGKSGNSTAPFWNVYSGSIVLLEKFMMQETACYIDKTWEDDYLFELDGIPDYKLDLFAYGDSGLLWQYVDSTLTPFLQKKRGGGYTFKRVSGNKLPLSADLINYLIRARDISLKQKYDSFELSITAMPTDLSEDALLYVSKTEVALQCAAGEQSLLNTNFIIKSKFSWEPSCGAVSIKLTIGNKIIERFYGGETGVYDFLNDFKSGVKRFELEDFPEHFYLLSQYKIKHIDVRLEIDGALKLMNSLIVKPPKVPEKLSACWM